MTNEELRQTPGYKLALRDFAAALKEVRTKYDIEAKWAEAGRNALRQCRETGTAVLNIFNYWNGWNIRRHRVLDDRIQTAIRHALKIHSEAEVCQAIANYQAILSNPDRYYFSYKWTLVDFLNRGLEKFLDPEIAKHNYARKPINVPVEQPRKKIEVVN